MILRLIPALRAAIAELWVSYFDAGAGPVTGENLPALVHRGVIPI